MKSDIRRRRIISALQTGFGGGGGSPVYGLYPSTDIAVLAGTAPAGTGAKGYLSFGGQAVNNSTGDLYYAYVAQDDHNQTKNGDGMAMRSTDVWSTHETPVQIVANPGGGVNIQDMDIFVTSTGRIIVFYTKTPTGLNQAIGYFKYTNNADLSGLSAEQQFTTDYGGQYINMTGSCVEINGVIYKSTWATTGGGTEIPIYKSEDDGETWTKISLAGTSAENYDETCLALHPDTGYVWAAIRDNASETLLLKYSTDQCATWSVVINTGVGAKAKHGFVISPQGMFCVVTRDSPTVGRTVLIQSNNGLTGWTKQFIDGRTGVYIYGTPVNHPTEGIIAMWSVEAPNVPTAGSSGPSLIISKRIAQSTTVVSPPTVYDPDYQGWLDYGQANGETRPSAAQRAIDNTCVETLRSIGALTEIDHYFLWEYNDASISNIKLRSVKQAWRIAIPSNSPTYGTTGYDFNGTTQSISLVQVLSQSVRFVQNDASMFLYVTENIAAGSNVPAGCGSGNFSTRTNATTVNPRNATDQFSYFINDGTNTTFANTDSKKFIQLQRRGASDKRAFLDGVEANAVSVASTGESTQPLVVGGERFADGVNFFSTRGVGVIGWGSAMDGIELDLHNAFAARRSALGL